MGDYIYVCMCVERGGKGGAREVCVYIFIYIYVRFHLILSHTYTQIHNTSTPTPNSLTRQAAEAAVAPTLFGLAALGDFAEASLSVLSCGVGV